MAKKKNRVKAARPIKVIEEKRYEIQEVFQILNLQETVKLPIEYPPFPEKKSGWTEWKKRMKHEILVDDHPVYSFSKRYITFYFTGTQCHCCGRQATHFRLEGQEGSPRRHFELYDDTGIVFTKKENKPKDHNFAYQEGDYITFCRECNNAAHRELQNKTSD